MPSATARLRFLPPTVFLLDVAVIALVAALSASAADRLPFFERTNGDGDLGLLGPLIAGGWLLMLTLGGSYRSQVLGGGSDEYRRVLNATLLSTSVIALVAFLSQASLSRGYFVLLFALGTPAVLVSRWSARKVLHGLRRRGHLMVPVLVAGAVEHIDDIAGVLQRESWLGYQVVGAITPDDKATRTVLGVPVVGSMEDATSAALRTDARIVLFTAGSTSSTQELRESVWDLEERGIDVVVAPGVTGITTDRITFRPVGGLPLMHLGTPAWEEATRLGKRLFDIVGAITLLLVFSPLLAFVALRIKLHDGGPVLFRQARIGRQGVPFRCAKFRTMIVDAEERLAELYAVTGYIGAGLFKMVEDPRVTKPGRWLRRYSIDELPQLWNVVRGDMSLVGPRPPLPQEVASYDAAVRRRLHVRPGMTGLWQVSGRSDLSWEDAVRLDLYYVDNWSMLQDLHILFRTLGAVVRARGAY